MAKLCIFNKNKPMKSLLNKSLPLILCAILVYGCNSNISKIKKPRIAIAGLAIESSTFSPARSGVDAFLAREGKDVFKYYRAHYVPCLFGSPSCLSLGRFEIQRSRVLCYSLMVALYSLYFICLFM